MRWIRNDELTGRVLRESRAYLNDSDESADRNNNNPDEFKRRS